jgi:hypothetical protein
MRKDALLKAIAAGDEAFMTDVPPERAVFLYDDENRKCCLILQRLITESLRAAPQTGNRHALPLPDVDLPLIF